MSGAGLAVAASLQGQAQTQLAKAKVTSVKKTWTLPRTPDGPWSVMIPLRYSPDALFEYACHEGNTGLEGILTGARAEEQAAARR